MIRDGIGSLEAGDFERLQAVLHAFLNESRIRCALLLDRDGRLLSAAGDAGGFDGTAFASLAAADFAASDQLALLLGEEEFTSLYHQGEHSSMYLVDVAGRAILAALFDEQRTTLGMVRVRTKTVVSELVSLFAEVAGRRPPVEASLGLGWIDEAEDEIDRLFAD